MSLPVVVILDHSGHFFATVQRRMKHEPFDLYCYYQNLKYIYEIERLQPKLIALSKQHGFPKNYPEVIAGIKSFKSLKNVPILLSLVTPLEEPEAEKLGVEVIPLDPSLEDVETLVAKMHELLDKPENNAQ
jgi:hypothetical protein